MKYIMFFEEFSHLNEGYSDKFKNTVADKLKLEKPELEKSTIIAYIEKFERLKDNALIVQKDITKYTWKELEKALDSLPVSNRIKAGKIDLSASEEIYKKDGIRIYPGLTKKLCIKYGNGYRWCISARGDDNMYDSYRMYGMGMPYFIFDDNKPKNDPSHAAVVFVYSLNAPEANEKLFSYSDAQNKGDLNYKTKDELIKAHPYLSAFQDRLVYQDLTDKKELETMLRLSYHAVTAGGLTQRVNTAFGEPLGTRISPVRPGDIGKIKETLDNKLDMYYYLSDGSKHTSGYFFADKSVKADELPQLCADDSVDWMSRNRWYDVEQWTPWLQPGYVDERNITRVYKIYKVLTKDIQRMYGIMTNHKKEMDKFGLRYDAKNFI